MTSDETKEQTLQRLMQLADEYALESYNEGKYESAPCISAARSRLESALAEVLKDALPKEPPAPGLSKMTNDKRSEILQSYGCH